MQPEILLLDEPTSAVDAAGTERVEQLLRTWQAEDSGQRAFLCVTHDQQQRLRLCNRFLELRAGTHASGAEDPS